MEEQYDIYLTLGPTTYPLLADLVPQAPALATPDVMQRLSENFPESGWLGLSIAQSLARTILERLERAGAVGECVRAAYRMPHVSQAEAQVIAERILPVLAARAYPGLSFSLAVFWREDPRWWVFGRSSDELVRRGHVPGAVLAHVDKLDGHLWTHEEVVATAH